MKKLAIAMISLTLLGATGPKAKSFTFTSSFKHGEHIPMEFTCESKDTNPSLRISGIPKKTRSFAIIMDDPDAPNGNWVHWVAWNIKPDPRLPRPPGTEIIPVGFPPRGTVAGKSSFGVNRYHGPCPPPGETHRYYFRLYALDVPKLKIPASSTAAKLRQAMRGHILKKAELMGRYSVKDM